MSGIILLCGVLALAALLGVLGARSHSSGPPGLVDGRLAPCPHSPNCVCSQIPDEAHQLPPIAFHGTEVEALERLLAVLQNQPRVHLSAVKGRYVHAEFTSRFFRFVDDVEFLIDPDEKVIHFRSASRVGHGDLGANRRRMEQLRQAFADSE